LALFLIISSLALSITPVICQGQERKVSKQPPPAKVTPPPRDTAVNDVNVQPLFKSAEELFKKDNTDESLRIFSSIYRYAKDMLTFLQTIQPHYEKLIKKSTSKSQEEKEELFIKQKRIQELTSKYTSLRIESAYYVGALYAKRGDTEQARKYLLEVCQTAPFSLNPKSTWLKSKNLLLALFQLEGEF